eukprot:Selendium_serpulae@DN6203_c0_g1_i10.p3
MNFDGTSPSAVGGGPSGMGPSYQPSVRSVAPIPNREKTEFEKDVYETIRTIRDPEFPQHSLEDLGVVHPNDVVVVRRYPPGVETPIFCQVTTRDREPSNAVIRVRPTTKHCSFAANIGLCIKIKLGREFDFGRHKFKLFIEDEDHIDAESGGCFRFWMW